MPPESSTRTGTLAIAATSIRSRQWRYGRKARNGWAAPSVTRLSLVFE